MALLCTAGKLCAQQNIHLFGGTLSGDVHSIDPSEDFYNLMDGKANTVYIAPAVSQFHVDYQSNIVPTVFEYALTAGPDSASRAPGGWMLQGSTDGSSWMLLDQQFGITFTPGERKVFTIANPTPYAYYRLQFFFNNGSNVTELAEYELLQSGSAAVAPKPTAKAIAKQGVQLNWSLTGNTKARGMIIERSGDAVHFAAIDTVAIPGKQYIDTNLCANSVFLYRLRVLDTAGASYPSATTTVTTNAVTALQSLNRFKDKRVYDAWNTRGVEGAAMAFDDDPLTKLYNGNSTNTLTYVLDGGATARQYAITSANDVAGRDPADWILEASADSTHWKTLDTRKGQGFADRHHRNLYAISNTKSYKYYRLRILRAIDNFDLQLADFQLLGDGNGKLDKTKPAKPAQFRITGISPYQLVLAWADSATNEAEYLLQYSADSMHWNNEITIAANNTLYYHRNLHPMSPYYYRLCAKNENGQSAWAYTSARTTPDAAPATWQEHWGQHDALLDRVYTDDDIRMYFDYAVDRQHSQWVYKFYSAVWHYVKQNYGTFSDPHLYPVLHSMPPDSIYSGGHPASVFDADHDYRNVTDVATGSGGTWADTGTWNHSASIHEMCHIVEGSSHDVKESPAFGIWGDSKWGEIFIYDVYNHLGPAYAHFKNELYAQMQTQYDDYPRPGTQWFKNWFYPIYDRSADSSKALARYFTLLSEYFPQRNGSYNKDMNMGEFVHFWSGAAGYNLKQQADTAFGWTDQMELQFQQARLDYPFTYPDEAPVKTPPANPGHGMHPEDCKALYPNPASGTIYLNGPDASESYLVDVYSLSGQRVLQTRAIGSNAPINIAALHNGLYLFVVNGKRGVAFTRLIVVYNK